MGRENGVHMIYGWRLNGCVAMNTYAWRRPLATFCRVHLAGPPARRYFRPDGQSAFSRRRLSFGYHRRFDDFSPGLRLQSRQPLRGLMDFFIGKRLSDVIHPRCVLSRATLEIGELPQQIAQRQSRDIRRFRAARPVIK